MKSGGARRGGVGAPLAMKGSIGNVGCPVEREPQGDEDMPEFEVAQSWDARRYAEHARFVADLGAPVLELLNPRPGEQILDIGCGDGALTAQLARAGTTVVGIDSSRELIAAALAAGVDARFMDAREIDFEGVFDAVFSNAALHWIREPERVLRGVNRALRPHGRFVAEFGGHGNVAAIRTALAAVLQRHGLEVAAPWYFPTVEEYTRLLSGHGFAVSTIALVARPTLLPTGLRGWLDTFANPFVAGVDAQTRSILLDAVTTLLAPILQDTDGRWTADYIRLRFCAIRE